MAAHVVAAGQMVVPEVEAAVVAAAAEEEEVVAVAAVAVAAGASLAPAGNFGGQAQPLSVVWESAKPIQDAHALAFPPKLDNHYVIAVSGISQQVLNATMMGGRGGRGGSGGGRFGGGGRPGGGGGQDMANAGPPPDPPT